MLALLRVALSLLILLCSCLVAAQTAATDFPSRPIRLIVPFPAGGSSDTLSRAVAIELSKRLGQPVVIDNRPGAGGNIGIDAVAKAPADGYTIGMASPGSIVINVALLDSMPYDPIMDLAFIGLIADLPIVLVTHVSVPAHNVKELIALDRSNPGKLSFASAGNGTTMHLAGELFNKLAGTKFVHVPYRGTAPAINDILGGQIQVGFLDYPAVAPHVNSGRIRLLAVGHTKRIRSAPTLPTIAESGVPTYEIMGWFGLVAPAGTPAPVIARLNAELVNAMNVPSVRDYLLKQGLEPRTSTPEQFATFIKNETPKWAEVIKFSGARN